MRNILFVVEGGIGKNIMGTAVLRSIRKAYPDDRIVVIASHPDIFLQNPHIYRVFGGSNPLHLYDDYIQDKDVLVLKSEPYLHSDYLAKKRHLVDVWCEQLGVPFDRIDPEIYLSRAEKKIAEAFMVTGKPPILVQISGGKIPEQKNAEVQLAAERPMHRRALPEEVWKPVINALREAYRVIQIRTPNQPGFDNVESVHSDTIRSIIALIPHAVGLLFVDSFAQHAAAAFGKPAVVVWGGTSPKILGYDLHINISREACPTPFCHRPNTYLYDLLPNGQLWDCSYGENCLKHDPGQILRSMAVITPSILPLLQNTSEKAEVSCCQPNSDMVRIGIDEKLKCRVKEKA